MGNKTLWQIRDDVIGWLTYTNDDWVAGPGWSGDDVAELPSRFSHGNRTLDVYLASTPYPRARLLSVVPDGDHTLLHRVGIGCPPGEIRIGRSYARVRGHTFPDQITGQIENPDFVARLTYPDGNPSARVDLQTNRMVDGLSTNGRLTLPPLSGSAATMTEIGGTRCTGITVTPGTYTFEAAGEKVAGTIGCRPQTLVRFILPGRNQLAGGTVDDLFALLQAGVANFIVKAQGAFLSAHAIVGGDNGRKLFSSVRALTMLAVVAGGILAVKVVTHPSDSAKSSTTSLV